VRQASAVTGRPISTPAIVCCAPQIQAELGEGHVNIVEAKEVVLTDHHLCLVMEYAAGNSLTGGWCGHVWRKGLRLQGSEMQSGG